MLREHGGTRPRSIPRGTSEDAVRGIGGFGSGLRVFWGEKVVLERRGNERAATGVWLLGAVVLSTMLAEGRRSSLLWGYLELRFGFLEEGIRLIP